MLHVQQLQAELMICTASVCYHGSCSSGQNYRRPIGDAYAELLPQGHGSANAKHLRGAEYAKNLLAVMAAC